MFRRKKETRTAVVNVHLEPWEVVGMVQEFVEAVDLLRGRCLHDTVTHQTPTQAAAFFVERQPTYDVWYCLLAKDHVGDHRRFSLRPGYERGRADEFLRSNPL